MIAAAILREARLRAGMTQAQLAHRSGHAGSAISRWERGDVKPSLETLIGLVECTGFQLSYSIVPFDPHDGVLIRRCLAATPSDRLDDMVRAVRAFDAMAEAAHSG